MLRSLKQAFLAYRYRHNTIGEMAVMLDNTICHARRCAYDLRHAASCIHAANGKELPEHKVFYDRAHMWIDLFAPNGAKEYRSQQGQLIARLERRIEELERIIDKAGLPDPERIPF